MSTAERIQIYEPNALCQHEHRFENGEVVYCEDCGAKGEIHRNVKELLLWR